MSAPERVMLRMKLPKASGSNSLPLSRASSNMPSVSSASGGRSGRARFAGNGRASSATIQFFHAADSGAGGVPPSRPAAAPPPPPPQRLQRLGQTRCVFAQIEPDRAEAEDLHRPANRPHEVLA